MPLPLLAIAGGASLLGSWMGANAQKDAARMNMRAMREASRPVTFSTGFGGVGYSTPDIPRPDISGMSPGEATKALAKWQDQMSNRELQTSLSGPYAQMRDMYAQGLTGENVALSPEAAAMRSSLYGMAPGMFSQAEQLRGMAMPTEMYGRGSFALDMPTADVSQIAADQYGMMQDIVAPERAKQREQLAEGLFARGMLGSTVAAAREGELQKAFGQQDLGMLQQALAEGRATRGMQLGEAQARLAPQITGAGMGMQQQGMLSNMANALYGQGLGTAQAGMGYDAFLQAMKESEQSRSMQGMMSLAGLEQNLMSMSRAGTAQNMQAAQAMAPYQMQAAQSPWAAALGGIGQGMMGMGMMGAFNQPPMGSTDWMQNQGFMAIPGTM
jgi:hypothetical protein